MMKYPEVTSVGEVLIDFVSEMPSNDLSTAHSFIKMAGGAPANVAVGLAKLGIRTAFVGKVGDDSFGKFLRSELKRHGVNIKWLWTDPDHKTRLAFVALTHGGDRDFEFWEKDPADAHLRRNDVDFSAVCTSQVVHISSFLLLNRETRETAFELAKHGKKKARIISFDPNIRLSLWNDQKEALRHYRAMIRYATVLRMNDAEAKLLTGSSSLLVASRKLLAMGPRLVVITQDKKGCFFATKKFTGKANGFSVRAVDTTGCGDGFLAGLLAGIVRSEKEVDTLSFDDLMSICRSANAVGAIVATRHGAIAAMPSADQLKSFFRSQQ
ncbi:MAG: carbohydrate kinase [Ignavibacteriales bacterium]|nr:carbohydrate kinase [Ignavibacteriales bacterium]